MIDQKLFQEITKYKQDIIAFAQDLIEIPSDTREGTNKIADFIYHKISQLGYEAQLLGRGKDYSVLFYPQQEKGKGIWLSAPLDTASVGDTSSWNASPYSGIIKDKKIYGRGSADCKVAIAYFIYGVKALQTIYPKLPGTIALSFDGGEHSGDFSGLKDILEEITPMDACLVGYPNNEEIFLGARGYVRFKIIIKGEAVHTGSRSQVGKNAITEALPILESLQKLQLPHEKNSLFPFGSKITISMIKSGTSINVVPDLCEISIDIRTVPSQTMQQVEEIIKELLETQRKKAGLMYELEKINGEDAFITDKEDRLVTLFHQNADEVFNKKLKTGVCGPANDGNVIANTLHIPVLCGFGCRFENLHGANECVYIEDIIPSTYTYMKTIQDFLEN